MITDSNQACLAKMTGRRVQEEVSMEPSQYNGGLEGIQKREYLANRNWLKEIRKGLTLIFKP